ncbi:MAG: hypothetical protein H7Z42_11855 [Roseiflexaceae bacterium]|nr:hypothetical protein [Roseiflexaceae bacterium]
MTQPRRPNPALAAARTVARRVIGEHFPEFKGVEPEVSLRTTHTPSSADMLRLGVRVPLAAVNSKEYTFTFARVLQTPDGHAAPIVARVTVDAKRRLIKAIRSK